MSSAGSVIPHLFRTEFARIVAVLCARFGLEHLQLAEDIAADTFVSAMETWPYRGVPANPAAWLHTVARNKAINQLKRDDLFATRITQALQQQDTSEYITFNEQFIRDSQLHMLFAVSHPALSEVSKICIALRILCGFGLEEIGHALLCSKETVHKRLVRAKEKLRALPMPLALTAESQVPERLDTVLKTLYLLFNEGYYSESGTSQIREELCREAMRLVLLLLEDNRTALPAVHALYALMLFQASRFQARKSSQGQMILYFDQDPRQWNQEMISLGMYHLHQSATGSALSTYHLEAAIASWHTREQDSPEKWETILGLYNSLLALAYSPVAALNRLYAFARVHGEQAAISEAETIQPDDKPYYHSLMGWLYRQHERGKAIQHLQTALRLARSDHERSAINALMETMAGVHK